MRTKWVLAVVPVALAVGCGSSAKSGTSPASAPTSVRTVTVTPSPTPALDTQGTIFCTLVDKARAESASAEPDILSGPDSGTGTALVDSVEDASKATKAAKVTSNAAVRTFITNIGAVISDADLAKARTVCESQGWVGTP